MIPQKSLSTLAQRLYKEKGGRRIPEEIFERDYCLAWFLVGLSKSPLAPRLVFKGGTLLKRCYFEDYRFSEDLDFTLREGTLTTNDLKIELTGIFNEVKRLSGIPFSFARLDHDTEKGLTFYISYDGPG